MLPLTTAFRFSDVAPTFDAHIQRSIPGYGDLFETVLHVTSGFVTKHGKVYDLGCSTGALLRELSLRNPEVEHVGYDLEPEFSKHWDGLNCHVTNALDAPLDNAGVILCLFILQFIEPSERLRLLRRIHASLLPGGALIIAEKTHFRTGGVQDLATSLYYAHKRESFTPEEILNKRFALVPVMRPSTSKQVERMLHRVGFHVVEQIWQRLHFRAWVAIKEI